jgi:hypothetical protein
VGLSATPSQSGNNTGSTSLTVGSASGTVYLTGTVQSSALNNGPSKAYTPSLTITDGGRYTSTAKTGTWTAYPAPTVGAVATPRSLTEGETDSVAIAYTCPDSGCVIALSGSVPGLGIGATSVATNNASTSVSVTATSGTVYISGLVSSGAVTGTALNAAYTPSVTITDGGTYTSAAQTANWTAYAPPTVSSPAARTITAGLNDSTSYTLTCPRPTCTVTLTNPVPGVGLSASAVTIGNNTVTSGTTNIAGTVTFYLAGTVQLSARGKSYSVTLQVSDGGSISSAAHSATWKVN